LRVKLLMPPDSSAACLIISSIDIREIPRGRWLVASNEQMLSWTEHHGKQI
jgi:hypothetical protein